MCVSIFVQKSIQTICYPFFLFYDRKQFGHAYNNKIAVVGPNLILRSTIHLPASVQSNKKKETEKVKGTDSLTVLPFFVHFNLTLKYLCVSCDMTASACTDDDGDSMTCNAH